jgi:hypothetical protein
MRGIEAGSLITFTSPPIMRASLRVNCKAQPGSVVALRGRGIGMKYHGAPTNYLFFSSLFVAVATEA